MSNVGRGPRSGLYTRRKTGGSLPHPTSSPGPGHGFPRAYHSLLTRLIWDCAVFGVPLGSGLLVNATVGWRPALAAFFVAAVLIGVPAYRADRRRRQH